MVHKLTVDYGGAQLRLDITENGTASLRINNIEREKQTIDSRVGILKLNTTVQTEYEWHEFIEAIVDFKSNEIVASIWASRSKLDQVVIKRLEIK